MMPRTSRRSRMLLALPLVVGGLMEPGIARADDPNPKALLRAVAAARNSVQSGKAKIEISYRNTTFARHPRPATRLEVSFDGVKRRSDQFCREGTYNPKIDDVEAKAHELDDDPDKLAAAGLVTYYDVCIRSSWDGERLVQYRAREHEDVVYKDEKKGTGYYLFDPRTLGIVSYYGMTTTVDAAFEDRPIRAISLVGREEVAGHSTWHVLVVDKFPGGTIERHHWVEDAPGYPVWKTEEVVGGRKTIVTASYRDPVAENPIPVLVMTSQRTPNGDQFGLTTLTVEQTEWNVPVDPATWNLATMGIPPATPVIDERLMKRVGYFDGEGLRDDFTEALRIGRERERANKPRP